MEKFLKDQEEQKQVIKNLTAQIGQLHAHNKMLESQIASQASSSRLNGMLPSQLQYPKEQAKAVTLRIGKQIPKVGIEEKEAVPEINIKKKQAKTPQAKHKEKKDSPPIVPPLLFP